MQKFFMLLAALFLPFITLAQHGQVFDKLSMSSEILDSERKYDIYLPHGL